MHAAASLNGAECPASLLQQQPIGEMKYETSLSTGWFCWIRSSAVKKTAHMINTNLCSHIQKMQSILLSQHIHSLQDTLNTLIIDMTLN